MEQWKDIKGYEGIYKISTQGKIYSIRSRKDIKTSKARGDYISVELNLKGVPAKYYVHRLVAEAFIPNPNKYPIINHKDENRINNHAENLEWCTYKYNSNYGTIKQKIKASRKPVRREDNPQNKKVYQFDMNGNLVSEYFSCAEAAEKTGFSRKSISKGCTGKLKVYMKFVWSHDGNFILEPKKRTPRKGAVLMYDMNHNLLKRYEFAKQVIQDGYQYSCVCRCCRGERNHYANHIWEYEK